MVLNLKNKLAKTQNRKDSRNRPSDFPWATYNTTRCPNCGSTDTHITRSERMTKTLVQRIHRCNQCQTGFRSEQILPLIDQAEDEKKDSADTQEPKNSKG